jgi:outer membrane cobalamin receptor
MWIAGKGSLHGSAASSVDLAASHEESRQGVPGSTEFPSPKAEQSDEFSSGALDLTGLLPGGGTGVASLLSAADRATSLGVFAQRRFRRYTDPENPLGAVDDSHRNEALGGRLEHRRDFGAAGRFLLSADARREELHSTTDGDHTRGILGISARQAIDVTTRIALTPALRFDRVDDYGSRLSPKLFGSWQLTPTTGLRASVGLSYRPPAFDDLFYPPRASAAGNPDLKPETSRDLDLGIRWERGTTVFGVTGFANRITDLIQWQPGAAGIWRPHNVDGARILGLEVEASGFIPLADSTRVELETNLTFLDPRETGSAPNTGGKVLIYRPRLKANALARLPLGRVTLETQWGWTGAVFLTPANTKELPGYLLGDLSLRWRAAPFCDLEARVLNLTDEIYEDYRGYPVPGREWRLAAVVRGRP